MATQKYASRSQAWAVLVELGILMKQLKDGKHWHDDWFYLADSWVDMAELVELKIKELKSYLPGDDVAKKSEKKNITWRGFKDVRLSDAQRDAYEHWDAQDADVYTLAAECVASGYKFTCSYNGSNDTFTASITGQENSPEASQGFTLSAFAPDFYNAIRTLMYKQWYILENDWSRIEVNASERWG